MPNLQTIPARRGIATILSPSQTLTIHNTHGHQVIDTFCFAVPTSSLKPSDPTAPLFPSATASSIPNYSTHSNTAASVPEYMSMSHTRASLQKLVPSVGDMLVSQKRAPMLEIVEDTSPGVHDTLIAACDRWRYAELGVSGYHESCTDNCWDALAALVEQLEEEKQQVVEGLQAGLGGRVPDPLNLFMNIPVGEGEGQRRALSFEPPVSRVGDFVKFKALRDVVVVMSACPQDVLEINGRNPVEAHFEVSD